MTGAHDVAAVVGDMGLLGFEYNGRCFQNSSDNGSARFLSLDRIYRGSA